MQSAPGTAPTPWPRTGRRAGQQFLNRLAASCVREERAPRDRGFTTVGASPKAPALPALPLDADSGIVSGIVDDHSQRARARRARARAPGK